MKKLLTKIAAALLVVATLCFCTSCKEIENGSEIHRVKITITLYDEDGVASTQDVYAKLYVNFAPETIEHIESLISSGYYNGTCISGISSDYAQFGDAKLNSDGSLDFIDQGSVVKGEFLANGWKGNKLTVGNGALVLKRSDVDDYESGKATVAVTFGTSSFDAKKYCVFGMIVDDDGDADADEDSWEYKSSFEKIKTLTSLAEDDDGTRVYYCDVDDTDVSADSDAYNWQGQYVTYAKVNDTYHYYKGRSTSGEVLTDDEQSDFEDKKSDNAKNFRVIPAKSAVIESITIVK